MAHPLHIVSDAYIYELQKTGGISRAYSEIFPRICELDATAEIDLVSFGRLLQPLPAHSRIHHQRVLPFLDILPRLRPRRRWKPLVAQARQMRLDRLAGSPSSIWHSTYYTAPRYWQGKKSVTVYDMIDEFFPDPSRQPKMTKSFQEVKREQIATADAVICISETTRQDVHHIYGIPLDRIDAVHLAYNQELFYPITEEDLATQEVQAVIGGLPSQKPFLLYVGARASYKNFALLIEAYARWPQRQDVDLVVVGIPWSANEQSLVQSSGVSGFIHLLANVGDAQLRCLYNRAQAFVYPSQYEGFGIPLLEAMACRCPIVASRIPSFVEVAKEYPVYFDPHSVDELSVALDRVMTQGRSRELMERGASILSEYSWPKTAEAYLTIYRRLLSRAG